MKEITWEESYEEAKKAKEVLLAYIKINEHSYVDIRDYREGQKALLYLALTQEDFLD